MLVEAHGPKHLWWYGREGVIVLQFEMGWQTKGHAWFCLEVPETTRHDEWDIAAHFAALHSHSHVFESFRAHELGRALRREGSGKIHESLA